MFECTLIFHSALAAMTCLTFFTWSLTVMVILFYVDTRHVDDTSDSLEGPEGWFYQGADYIGTYMYKYLNN